jgi:hypothetical protein
MTNEFLVLNRHKKFGVKYSSFAPQRNDVKRMSESGVKQKLQNVYLISVFNFCNRMSDILRHFFAAQPSFGAFLREEKRKKYFFET